jgi:lipopolysaccharide biosynthesis glycosyltransferase
MASALGHCPVGTRVIFIGTELTPEQMIKLRGTIAQFDQVDLHFHALNHAVFGEINRPDPRLPLAALARLFLPSIARGRVLYIDGDTLICDALSPLFALEMEGFPIAAVRDQHVLRQAQKAKPDLAYFQTLMVGHPATDYFNAGVLLMDLDAIRKDADLVREMQDFSDLEGYRFLDQDHLNRLFAGRAFFLAHRWNFVWGRSRFQNQLWAALSLPVGESNGQAPEIVHFTGPKKPWEKLRFSMVSKSLRSVLKYLFFSGNGIKDTDHMVVERRPHGRTLWV